jgi:membrane-associated HD superfamily phosphohydrolase
VKNRITLYLTAPTNLLWGILGFLSAVVLIIYGVYKGTEPGDTFKFCLISFVLLTITVYYIGSQHEKIEDKPFFHLILIGSYLISLLMILTITKPDEILFWLSGGLIISILFDMQIGLLYTYNLIMIASFIGKLNAQSIVFLLIIGTLICMLSNSMKKQSTLWYSIIIVLSVQITLHFIISNFDIWDAMKIDVVYNLISLLISIGFATGFSMYYHSHVKNIDELKEEMAVSLNIDESLVTETKELDINNLMNTQLNVEFQPIGTHTYDEILDFDFPLMQRLKLHSDSLYNNAIRTSEICEKAALVIGAREKLAKAGGLYYSIGLIDGKHYIESGLKLIEEYHMPDFLKEIINQHNLKYDKPKTPEAALVMLTISILTSRDILLKKQKVETASGKEYVPISMEKIVEHVFLLRLTKGSLDESGLTVKQYNELKNYFLHM